MVHDSRAFSVSLFLVNVEYGGKEVPATTCDESNPCGEIEIIITRAYFVAQHEWEQTQEARQTQKPHRRFQRVVFTSIIVVIVKERQETHTLPATATLYYRPTNPKTSL
jgi:hypothetical protein